MSYRKRNRSVYECHCECINEDGTPCGHNWTSFTLPKRCSACKRYTWNGTDRRVKVITNKVVAKKKKAA